MCGARARHLFPLECPSLGKTDRNPVRTHPRDPKGPHPSVTKPEGHFYFSPANWSGVTAEGPTPPRTPVTACSKWRFRSKIGKPYRQLRPDCCSLSHIINSLSDVLDRQKRSNGDLSGPKIRICFVQSTAALRISTGNEGAAPPVSLNFSDVAAIYRQYHRRSIDHAHHELC